MSRFRNSKWIAGCVAVALCSVTATNALAGTNEDDRLPVRFEKIALPRTSGTPYTNIAIGPDRYLYATADHGVITRWRLQPGGRLGRNHAIRSLRRAEDGPRLTIGFCFDPASTADNLIAWVSHSTFGFTDMEDWSGKITRLSGPRLEVVEDVVVGLPRSTRDHVTNGIAFGPDGALYIAQGSTTAMGAPDPIWGWREEHALSGAILRLDPNALPSLPLDARTDGEKPYDPTAVDAPLTVFASGVRNAYDLVWTESGHLYAPINGSADGGNTPGTIEESPCSTDHAVVPPLTNVGERRDYLINALEGMYYGHPNPERCEFVLNGGNPTAGADPAEVVDYPVGTLPEPHFGGFAYDFGAHASPNGIVEYTSDVFGSSRRGALFVSRFNIGQDIVALRPDPVSGAITRNAVSIPGCSDLDSPLALAIEPTTGSLYVSEYGAKRITLLKPVLEP